MAGKSALIVFALLLATAGWVPPALATGNNDAAGKDFVGAVFTMSNSAVRGNEIVAYNRGQNGSLKQAGVFPTGSLGAGPSPTSTVFGVPIPATADSLGSQRSL